MIPQLSLPSMIGRRLLGGVLALSLLMLLVACSSAPPQAAKTDAVPPAPTVAPAAKAVATEAPKVVAPTTAPVGAKTASKTLTIGMVELLKSLDPPTDWAIPATWIHMNIFDCLVWRNRQTGAFEPWLATEWKNTDPTTWRFTLRKGVEFHNGEKFTADAVVWTYERILADKTMITYPQWTHIKQLKRIDDYTVDIITATPEPAMLSKMAGTGCGIQAPEYGKKAGPQGAATQPVGTGPFMFKEWVKDDHITLTANPKYWQGKPDIDTLIFRSLPETATRVGSLLTGNIDLAVGVPAEDWKRIKDNSSTTVQEFLTNRTMLLALRLGPSEPMPTWKGPTSDPLVRKAINLAIDRAAIIKLINGMGVPTMSRITPPTLGWSDKFFNQLGKYDPVEAKKLLAQSTYKGEPLTFHAAPAFLYEKEVAEAVAAMLKDIGLNIDFQFMDLTTFREKIYVPNKTAELYMDALGNSFFDPWITVKEFEPGQKQRSGWQNAEADKLILAAAQNMNPEERTKQYIRVQELINEDLPHIYLYLMKDAIGMSKRVKFEMGPDGFLWMGQAKVE
ncbi:MAG: ABC transporter substrate-binding protein [Anaerolineae bacterium]|nr:ABC transporter substrate-binding protein [Anaerolineae bacterium]